MFDHIREWLGAAHARAGTPKARRSRGHARPLLEILETRALPTTAGLWPAGILSAQGNPASSLSNSASVQADAGIPIDGASDPSPASFLGVLRYGIDGLLDPEGSKTVATPAPSAAPITRGYAGLGDAPTIDDGIDVIGPTLATGGGESGTPLNMSFLGIAVGPAASALQTRDAGIPAQVPWFQADPTPAVAVQRPMTSAVFPDYLNVVSALPGAPNKSGDPLAPPAVTPATLANASAPSPRAMVLPAYLTSSEAQSAGADGSARSHAFSSREAIGGLLPVVSEPAKRTLAISDGATEARSPALATGEEAATCASIPESPTSLEDTQFGRAAVGAIDTRARTSVTVQRESGIDSEVVPVSGESNARPVVDRNESLPVPSAISWRRWLLLLSAATVGRLTAHGKRWVTRIKVKDPRCATAP
jgi:hypothetical protein